MTTNRLAYVLGLLAIVAAFLAACSEQATPTAVPKVAPKPLGVVGQAQAVPAKSAVAPYLQVTARDVFTDVLVPVGQFEEVSPAVASEKKCLSCHEGVESINEKMAKAWGADKNCEVCHKGNPTAGTKTEAHKGMIVNPGDFRVIAETCGQCHDDGGVIRPDIEGLIPAVVSRSRVTSNGERNHVSRNLRSSMATAAGEIASTRYLWNAQDTKNALYAVRAITDTDGVIPGQGTAVAALQTLPPATNSDADNLLRNECLKCHLWTKGESKPGLYRSTGCSACHVLYADDGLSKTKDPTISKLAPGRPLKHEITVKVPTSQCMRCHNDGGARIGLNYTGQVVSTSGLPYREDATKQPKLYGINTLRVKADVHFERGLECIDCHTSSELHGDGNLYVRKEYEVGIRCESCHGTPDKPATLKDALGRKLNTLYRSGEDVVQTGKLDGRKHTVRQIDKLAERNALPVAMRIPAHVQDIEGRNKLDCASCHARTAQQCYGCHLKKDERQMSPVDWVEGIGEGTEAKPSPGRWIGEFVYLRWEDPTLGINARNLVAPFIPGSQVFFTKIGLDGKIQPVNMVTDTVSGASRLSMNPTQPHSITRAARTCESCHNDPKAVGLGSGYVATRDQGWSIDFPLDRFVDEAGRQLQEVSHPQGRPFSVEERSRISSVNSCLGCHKDMDNKDFWQQVVDASGVAKTARDHQDVLSRIFRRGALNVKPIPTPESKPVDLGKLAPSSIPTVTLKTGPAGPPGAEPTRTPGTGR